MIPIPPGSSAAPAPHAAPGDTATLRAVATELEAGFLEEMLKHAGFGESREALGGGAGEDQFGSLLRREHARALAAQGGIGLAEALFTALAQQAGPAESEGR